MRRGDSRARSARSRCWRRCSSWRAAPRCPATAEPPASAPLGSAELDRRAHDLRGRVPRGGVRRARRGVRVREPRHRRPARSSTTARARSRGSCGRAREPTSSRRPTRRTWPRSTTLVDGTATSSRPTPSCSRRPRAIRRASTASPTSPIQRSTVVLCEPEVPCGAASQRLLDAAGVDRRRREPGAERDRRADEGRLRRRRRRARLPHRCRRARTDVDGIVPEGAADVVNRYPIAALTESANPRGRARLRGLRDRCGRTADPGRARVRGAVSRRRAGFLPPVLAVPAILGLALLVVPLAALVARVEWSTLWADITSPAAVDALLLSLRTGLIATAVCVLLGVPLALVIARSGPRSSALLRVLVTVPLVLPPMVGGVALLFLFGRSGPLGAALEDVGPPHPVHDDGGRAGADLRRAPVPRARAGGIAAHRGRRLRARRGHPRRRAAGRFFAGSPFRSRPRV